MDEYEEFEWPPCLFGTIYASILGAPPEFGARKESLGIPFASLFVKSLTAEIDGGGGRSRYSPRRSLSLPRPSTPCFFASRILPPSATWSRGVV